MRREKTYRRRSERWSLRSGSLRASGRRWTLPMGVVMLMIAQCFGSCATTKKAENIEVKRELAQGVERDSVRTEVRIVKTEVIPGSEVSLSVPVDSLLKLPATASYIRKSGQAGAKVSREGGNIVVVATCDSLAAEVDYYESLYASTREERDYYKGLYEERYTAQQKSNAYGMAFVAFIVGLISGIVLTILIKKRYGK